MGGVGRRNNIFILLPRENVNRSKVALSMSMLSSFGGGYSRDLFATTKSSIQNNSPSL
jgi:hypothetical protein